MRVHIDDIKDEGLNLEFVEEADTLPELQTLALEEGWALRSPLRVRLRLFRIDTLIEVEGEIAIDVELACSRCLATYVSPVDGRFSLTFAETLPEVEVEDGDEVELDAEEMGITLLEGEELDLDAAIHEQVLLALPLRPLCDEACKGLCSNCGENLNDGDCGCDQHVLDPRFAALKNLKIDQK
ncbi:MAG: hypothetical protein C0621_09295 [Desulfuromonas sp.]|nr:MAG: hypothetical protein C0621_09295 [Desulfuromonas sp.]